MIELLPHISELNFHLCVAFWVISSGLRSNLSILSLVVSSIHFKPADFFIGCFFSGVISGGRAPRKIFLQLDISIPT